jgi:hypothetical protein
LFFKQTHSAMLHSFKIICIQVLIQMLNSFCMPCHSFKSDDFLKLLKLGDGSSTISAWGVSASRIGI